MIQDLLRIARIIIYPNYEREKKSEYLCLPSINSRYDGMNLNHHHFTTKYHRMCVWPFLCRILGISYSRMEWVITKNYVTEGNKIFDLSYSVPKKDKNFTIEGFEYGIKYDCGFNGLMWNEIVKETTWVTEYHKLYAFPHSSSRITNNGENNNRKLLILGDSQTIPDVAILAYYFREVWYIDNRKHIDIYSRIKEETFDNVLIIMSGKSGIDYYKEFLKEYNQ